MTTSCPYTVQLISQNEYIGNSLDKINSNFTSLASAACNLQQYIQSKVSVRTFFYYGPNSTAQPDPTSNIQDNLSTRPSNNTIQTFVNSATQLNLLPISKKNDQVYVIYQKTGWSSFSVPYTQSGSGAIPYPVPYSVPIVSVIGIGRKTPVVIGYETRYVTQYSSYTWSQTVNDINYNYYPNFIVYRLTHDGTDYKADTGFPRFVRAQTANTINWNNPKLWLTY